MTRQRGVPVASAIAAHVVATVHPSSILRAPNADARRREMELFIADLRAARALVAEPAQPSLP